MSIAGEGGGRRRRRRRWREGGRERAAAGRGGVGRGLSYSLPVTYYELIPTAPVKYYCKILTVICARERNAGTLRARARLSSLTNARQRIASSHFRIFCQPVYILPEFISTPSTPGNVETWRPPLGLLRALCICVTTTITDTTIES